MIFVDNNFIRYSDINHSTWRFVSLILAVGIILTFTLSPVGAIGIVGILVVLKTTSKSCEIIRQQLTVRI